jgi:hypothetical protein
MKRSRDKVKGKAGKREPEDAWDRSVNTPEGESNEQETQLLSDELRAELGCEDQSLLLLPSSKQKKAKKDEVTLSNDDVHEAKKLSKRLV